jgi:hypothetical protein
MKIKKAAITTQCAWRGRVARKELRNLKMVTTSSFVMFSFYLLGLMLRHCLGKRIVVTGKIDNEILFLGP